MRDTDIQKSNTALKADLVVWIVDAQSYISCSPKDVLCDAENPPKNIYLSACEERSALFTPFCYLVDGVIGREAEVFCERIGESLALKVTVKWWYRLRFGNTNPPHPIYIFIYINI